jgi:Superinfection immunity protein
MGEFSPFHWLVVIAILVLPYFIPAFVGRNKRNAKAIFWLNFFLGWTFVGWIAVLIWALTNDPVPTQVIVNQPAQSSVLCASCGKYSVPGTKFCSMCGAQIVA